MRNSILAILLVCAILYTQPFTTTEPFSMLSDGSSANSNTISVRTGQFSSVSSDIAAVNNGDSDWGDFDNDGDLDLLLTGESDSGNISKLYRNEGNYIFTPFDVGLTPVNNSSVCWGDYNNDEYLDILLSGTSDSGNITKIYKNNADSSFTDINAGLEGTSYGSDWGDYNSDGLLDVLMGNGNYYINYNGSFSLNSSGISGVCKWFDYDNDGDYDISREFVALDASETIASDYSRLYINENSSFTFVQDLQGKINSWSDYNNDNILDFITQGSDDYIYGSNPVEMYTEFTKLYRSNGSSYEMLNLYGLYSGSSGWGDFDNNGNMDFVYTGLYYEYTDYPNWDAFCDTRIINTSSDGSLIDTITEIGVYSSSSDWVDLDNDGDLDLFLTGLNTDSGRILRLFKNNSTVLNSVPMVPDSLNSEINDNIVTLSWNPSYDNETVEEGLSYNIYILTETRDSIIINSMSDPGTGFRKIVEQGNCGNRTQFSVNLPVGEYFWSVQAIDNCYAGSEFSPERTFTIDFIASPQNITVLQSGSDMIISWDVNPSITSSTVYSSEDPYAAFPTGWTEEVSGISVTNWTDTNVTGTRKFYVVVGVNGTKKVK